jgi:hypothetical protein
MRGRYTMVTLNADSHPRMSRMHKPDPKMPSDQQDKRSVVPIELADVDRWWRGGRAGSGTLRLPDHRLFTYKVAGEDGTVLRTDLRLRSFRFRISVC